jgi:ankyrin repeat protein
MPGEFPRNIENIINSKDKYGNTPLMLACVYTEDEKSGSKFGCIKYLLELGADPNV